MDRGNDHALHAPPLGRARVAVPGGDLALAATTSSSEEGTCPPVTTGMTLVAEKSSPPFPLLRATSRLSLCLPEWPRRNEVA